jgi:hypothetical protein
MGRTATVEVLRKKTQTVIDLLPRDNVMMRILVVSIFGALLASCSGSSRVEDLLRANAPPHPATQYTPRKSTLDNRSSPNNEAGTTAKAEPQEAPRSTAQSPSEE